MLVKAEAQKKLVTAVARRGEDGQALVEYSLIIALVALAALATLGLVGAGIVAMAEAVINSL